MARRLELQVLLENLLGSDAVYFQPPSDHQMEYPCIVYELDDMDTTFADNVPYWVSHRYQVTSIDRDPDSETPDKIVHLPKCRFDRAFKADNLNHHVFNLVF